IPTRGLPPAASCPERALGKRTCVLALRDTRRAMSEENVETVRRYMKAISTGPAQIVASASEFLDADADYYPVRKFPETRPCHGREDTLQFFARFRDAWSRLDWPVEEIVEVGDDRVLVRTAVLAEGRGSGVKLEGDLYICVWLRHGRVFRQE